MIVDLDKFLAEGRCYWAELEAALERLGGGAAGRLDLPAAQRFHYLYERTAADLARLETFASAPAVRQYLESLVSRAYCQIHEARAFRLRLAPLRWLGGTLPRTFRRHARAFALSAAVTLVGAAFGAFAFAVDPEAKDAIVPFRQLLERPSGRVAREESRRADHLAGHKATGAAMYMHNNISVSLRAMALGMTWGVGTVAMLFYNGVLLGLISADYVADGQAVFLLGWLLPHGATEIPAILLAGQAGLVLGGAMIGWGSRLGLRRRLRAVGPDLVTLAGGVALLLVWAGIVEAFFSQYHEPVLPYAVKIAFGAAQLVALTLYLALAGRGGAAAGTAPPVETRP